MNMAHVFQVTASLGSMTSVQSHDGLTFSTSRPFVFMAERLENSLAALCVACWLFISSLRARGFSRSPAGPFHAVVAMRGFSIFSPASRSTVFANRRARHER